MQERRAIKEAQLLFASSAPTAGTRAIRGLGTTHTPASLAALGGAELKAMLDWHPLRPAFGGLLRANA